MIETQCTAPQHSPTKPIDDTIVFLAFRYCLSAQSYAVGTCATYLVQH